MSDFPPESLPGDACAYRGEVYFRGTLGSWMWQPRPGVLRQVFAAQPDPISQSYAKQLRAAILEAKRHENL
jgi:hypothetical protein